MHQAALFSNILRSKWLLDPLFVMSQGPVIAGLVNRQSVVGEPTSLDNSQESKEWRAVAEAYAIKPGAGAVGQYSLKYRTDDIQPGSTAVINLEGALMKVDDCGSAGMASIGSYIKKADLHPNIDRIIIRVDSPGGTVDGTKALADIVKGTATEIITLVDGQMCSAALWIGSSSDEIWATTEMDEIGSVGVLLSFMDAQPYYEKLGVKFHTVTASTSPEKVKWFEELKAGNYDNYKKEVLDPLDALFMATVRENCPNVQDEHLTGKVFFAKDLMGIMVDKIGTLDDILSTGSAHPQKTKEGASEATTPNLNTKSMKKYAMLAGLMASAGLTNLEVDADGAITLNEEQLTDVNKALESYQDAEEIQAIVSEHETAIGALETERDSALKAQGTAEDDLATANAEIVTLKENASVPPAGAFGGEGKGGSKKSATENAKERIAAFRSGARACE
jgi:ClpP class serine protease